MRVNPLIQKKNSLKKKLTLSDPMMEDDNIKNKI